MKKLEKLTLKELTNVACVIQECELPDYLGGARTAAQWTTMSDNEKAQYICDTYKEGGCLDIEGGIAAGGWSTGACGATVTNGSGASYQVVISISSLINDLGSLGFCVDDDYVNSCGTWTKIYVGNNATLMINPAADVADEFVDAFMR